MEYKVVIIIYRMQNHKTFDKVNLFLKNNMILKYIFMAQDFVVIDGNFSVQLSISLNACLLKMLSFFCCSLIFCIFAHCTIAYFKFISP